MSSRELVYGYSQSFTAIHGLCYLCVPVNQFTCESSHRVFKPLRGSGTRVKGVRVKGVRVSAVRVKGVRVKGSGCRGSG